MSKLTSTLQKTDQNSRNPSTNKRQVKKIESVHLNKQNSTVSNATAYLSKFNSTMNQLGAQRATTSEGMDNSNNIKINEETSSKGKNVGQPVMIRSLKPAN